MLLNYDTTVLPRVRMMGRVRYHEPWCHFSRVIDEYILYVIRDGDMYLEENGVRMENFFCASPVCSPARASLLTGRIPSQHGVHDWIRCGAGEVHGDSFSRTRRLQVAVHVAGWAGRRTPPLGWGYCYPSTSRRILTRRGRIVMCRHLTYAAGQML